MRSALKNVIIILALVTLTTGCGDLDSDVGSSSGSSGGERGAALQYAEKIIRPALKAPTTADFPWEEIKSTRLNPITDLSGETAERWRVTGAVDAQNSFGAMIRSWWTMEIMLAEGNFMLGTASLEGETVFELPSYQNLVTMSEAIEAASEDGQVSRTSDAEKEKPSKTEQYEYLNYLAEVNTYNNSSTAARLIINLVWEQEPSFNEVRRAIERETQRHKPQGLDMSIYIYHGDHATKSEWSRVVVGNKYMSAKYDAETRDLTPSWDW